MGTLGRPALASAVLDCFSKSRSPPDLICSMMALREELPSRRIAPDANGRNSSSAILIPRNSCCVLETHRFANPWYSYIIRRALRFLSNIARCCLFPPKIVQSSARTLCFSSRRMLASEVDISLIVSRRIWICCRSSSNEKVKDMRVTRDASNESRSALNCTGSRRLMTQPGGIKAVGMTSLHAKSCHGRMDV
jgi:hypothetical protein